MPPNYDAVLRSNYTDDEIDEMLTLMADWDVAPILQSPIALLIMQNGMDFPEIT